MTQKKKKMFETRSARSTIRGKKKEKNMKDGPAGQRTLKSVN